MPTFMCRSRYDWSAAPMPLIEFFGMRVARDGWDAERRAMDTEMTRISNENSSKADRIVAECGPVAREIMQEGGTSRLFAMDAADPTLGLKLRKALR